MREGKIYRKAYSSVYILFDTIKFWRSCIFSFKQVWYHIIASYDIIGWSCYLFVNALFWLDLLYSSMTNISADPCCSRGRVSEEKLPAASPSFTAVVLSPCDRVLGPELCKTKASNNLEAGSSAGRQVKARFEASFI